MFLTSPKPTMSKFLPVATVVAVESGLSEAGLFASVILELVKASLSLMAAMLSLAVLVHSEDLVPVESAATVPSLSVVKLPGEPVA